MTKKIEKNAPDYQNLCEVEKIRKKLNTNGHAYEKFISVQSGTIYATNGFYMIAVKAEEIEDGVYQVVKNKNEVILIPDSDGTRFPVCTEIEQLCSEYSEYSQFEMEWCSSRYCQIIRAFSEDIIDFDIFKPLHETGFFHCFRICTAEHKPIVLFDSETESTKRAYIMPMIAH